VFIGPYTKLRPDGAPWTPGAFLTQTTFVQRVPSNLTSIAVPDGPVLIPGLPPPSSSNQSPSLSGAAGGAASSPPPDQAGGDNGSGSNGFPSGTSNSEDVGKPASIAGVAVGAAVGSLCLALGVLLYIRYRQQRKDSYKLPPHLPRKNSERASGSTTLFGWFGSKVRCSQDTIPRVHRGAHSNLSSCSTTLASKTTLLLFVHSG
jgi:hypothetical protein